jgi:FMN phosphatase YigB (HAD superfamily)
MKTFLFDLDGTLLAMDSQDFMHAYFDELTRALYGLLPTQGLAGNILTATARMQADTSPESSNLVMFRREFDALYQDIDQQAVWDRIMEFYATTFDNVHDVVKRNEPLYRSVVYLRTKGHRVLLTTNPVFPQLPTYKRLAWAGFSPDTFEYISTLENWGYCKPHVEYWHHVATIMDVDPAQAVAVGNDCIEDVSAGLAGIETYLVTDYVIGDIASSGADHISDALGFERWILENY